MSGGKRLTRGFYTRDVLDVAPELIGKDMIISLPGGSYGRYMITETEAYRGAEDKACHASKGRTARTEIMFHEGGHLYIYFIYGMYYMLNIVTGEANNPQAVLIRGVESISGPGRFTKYFSIDKSFNGVDLTTSERIWIEDSQHHPVIRTSPRIGVDYSGDPWKSKPWRYFI
jgi:DNA-3-methyladenine glycosylase